MRPVSPLLRRTILLTTRTPLPNAFPTLAQRLRPASTSSNQALRPQPRLPHPPRTPSATAPPSPSYAIRFPVEPRHSSARSPPPSPEPPTVPVTPHPRTHLRHPHQNHLRHHLSLPTIAHHRAPLAPPSRLRPRPPLCSPRLHLPLGVAAAPPNPPPPHDPPRPVRWTVRSSSTYEKGKKVRTYDSSCKDLVQVQKADEALDPVGHSIPREDKVMFLLGLINELKDSKEAVYGALDAWVGQEHKFPHIAIRKALTMLEKEEQWHRIVQVIKWMLSKGQGTTRGTYEQLIRALEKDCRAEEAHAIWVQKFRYDLRHAPWHVCELMISIYYRNNMLGRLVKLFERLEAFDRKPPNKAVVLKVTDAYEKLGFLEEKSRVMDKYAHLFENSRQRKSSKSQRALRLKQKVDPDDGGKLYNRQKSNLASVEPVHPEEMVVENGPTDIPHGMLVLDKTSLIIR